MRTIVLLALSLAAFARAESKTEADLRARLATLEAVRIEAAADRAALHAAIAKLNLIHQAAPKLEAAALKTAQSTAQSTSDRAVQKVNENNMAVSADATATITAQAAIAAAAAAVAAAQSNQNTAKLQESTSTSNTVLTSLLITSLATLLLAIVKMAYDYIMESSRRRWAIEDAERIAAAKAAENAASWRHREQVIEKLSEVKAVAEEGKVEARAAFVEANTVNRKIESVGLQVRDGQPLSGPPVPTVPMVLVEADKATIQNIAHKM